MFSSNSDTSMQSGSGKPLTQKIRDAGGIKHQVSSMTHPDSNRSGGGIGQKLSNMMHPGSSTNSYSSNTSGGGIGQKLSNMMHPGTSSTDSYSSNRSGVGIGQKLSNMMHPGSSTNNYSSSSRSGVPLGQKLKQRMSSMTGQGTGVPMTQKLQQKLPMSLQPKIRRRKIVDYRHSPVHSFLFNFFGAYWATMAALFYFWGEFVWHFFLYDAPLFRLEDRFILKMLGVAFVGISALTFAKNHMTHRIVLAVAYGHIVAGMLLLLAFFNYRKLLSNLAFTVPILGLIEGVQLLLAATDIIPIHQPVSHAYGSLNRNVSDIDNRDYYDNDNYIHGDNDNYSAKSSHLESDRGYSHPSHLGGDTIYNTGVSDRNQYGLQDRYSVSDVDREGLGSGYNYDRHNRGQMLGAEDRVDDRIDTAAYPTEYVDQTAHWDDVDRRAYAKGAKPGIMSNSRYEAKPESRATGKGMMSNLFNRGAGAGAQTESHTEEFYDYNPGHTDNLNLNKSVYSQPYETVNENKGKTFAHGATDSLGAGSSVRSSNTGSSLRSGTSGSSTKNVDKVVINADDVDVVDHSSSTSKKIGGMVSSLTGKKSKKSTMGSNDATINADRVQVNATD